MLKLTKQIQSMLTHFLLIQTHLTLLVLTSKSQ